MVKKLINELKWCGLIHIDLRYDKKNEFKIIEVNPRVWSSIEASNRVGVNFPYLYVLSSINYNYGRPKYKHEEFSNNTGLIKILKAKIKRNKNTHFPKHHLLKNIVDDPTPQLYSFVFKYLNKILKNNKFLKIFKYDVY